MRYLCIDRCRNQYPIRMMCRVLKVSKSGYYDWRGRPESNRAKTDRELLRLSNGFTRLATGSMAVPESGKISKMKATIMVGTRSPV